jgi:hypothetical protein
LTFDFDSEGKLYEYEYDPLSESCCVGQRVVHNNHGPRKTTTSLKSYHRFYIIGICNNYTVSLRICVIIEKILFLPSAANRFIL